MTLQRMQHVGAAPLTGVASNFSSSATSFQILSGTGYPTGSPGPFVLKIDAGTASEEKILCSSLSGTTVTVASGGRGWDNTSAFAHNSGTTNVEHDFAAIEADDANDHIYTTTRDDHTQYARTDGTRTFTGQITVPDLVVSGLTGATATGRYVGQTTAGAPVSGTFSTGDWVTDNLGNVITCQSGGTPGTWLPTVGAQVAYAVGPATTSDSVNNTITIATCTFNYIAGVKYIVAVHAQGEIVTSTPSFANYQLSDSASLLPTAAMFLVSLNSTALIVSGDIAGCLTTRLAPSGSGSETLTLTASCGTGGGALRTFANTCEIVVWRAA